MLDDLLRDALVTNAGSDAVEDVDVVAWRLYGVLFLRPADLLMAVENFAATSVVDPPLHSRRKDGGIDRGLGTSLVSGDALGSNCADRLDVTTCRDACAPRL